MPRCHTRNTTQTALILERVLAGELKVTRAAELLRVTRRQVYRLRDRFLANGSDGLKPRNRGRPGNGYTTEFRDQVIDLVRLYYPDFGPTLAAEKLAERHKIKVSREWLRLAMIRAGIWQDRLDRQPRVHQLRKPCERRGEVVQIDGSHHRWFEDRGPKCALLVFIDDATSELLHIEFAPSESTLAYMKAATTCIKMHGKPIAFYSDKHTVFRKSRANTERNAEPTQFGRALMALRIGMINAESAQAKGRVERANRTLQDRLIKEMRLQGISTIDEANKFAREYIAAHNLRFARAPASAVDAHRSLGPEEDLNSTFRWEEPRKLTKDLSLNYNKRIFILEPSRAVRAIAGRNVMVCEYPDGLVTFEYEGTPIPCIGSFDKLRRIEPQVVSRKLLEIAMEEIKGEIMSAEAPLPSPAPHSPPLLNDRLDAALAMAAELQNSQPHHRQRNRSGPARLVLDGGLFPELKASSNMGAEGPVNADGLIKRKLSRQLSFQHRCTGYVIEDTFENRNLIGHYLLIRESETGDVLEVTYEGRTIAHGHRSDRAKSHLKRPLN